LLKHENKMLLNFVNSGLPLVEQEQLTLPEHLSSPMIFVWFFLLNL